MNLSSTYPCLVITLSTALFATAKKTEFESQLGGAPCVSNISDRVIETSAESSRARAEYGVLAEWGEYDFGENSWCWSLQDAHEFQSGHESIAELLAFDALIIEDPEIHVSFSVQAGSDTTQFNLGSSAMPIGPYTDPTGWVNVTLTLTDIDGDGASLTGSGPNGGAFLARYNAEPLFPAGITFAECFTSVSADPYEIVTVSCLAPPTLIPGVVFNMRTLATFELSAHDTVAVSGSYVIEPCYGDLVRDGAVDLSDLAELLSNYGETSGVTYRNGDMDMDGDVDLDDLLALLGEYGATCQY